MSTRALLKSPPVAWPTLLLWIAVVAAWSGVQLALWSGALSLPWAALWSGVLAFVAFTPMHDASHKAVARQGWVNAIVGRSCGLILTAPFPAFRVLHLRHHRHTNEPHDDPDFWSGLGPFWLLPLRWVSQDLHYYVDYFGRIRGRRKAEVAENIAWIMLFLGLIAWAGYAGTLATLLLGWFLPARLAIGALAFAFDYLPHRPHKITSAEDRYRATCIREVPALSPLLLYQNYHLVHHLYPGVPFYRYSKVWYAKRDDLIAKGAIVRDLWGRPIDERDAPPAAPASKVAT